jgi:glycopeptide antibiotics resistance protein
MLGIWRAFGALLPLGIIGAGLLVVTIAAWRRLAPAGRRRAAVTFLAIWALGLLAVTLRPRPGWLDAHNVLRYRDLNLVPFSEIGDSLTNSVTWHVPFEQIMGNCLLFAPLGVGLVMLGGRISAAPWGTGFIAGAGAGIGIELAQWVFGVGRVSSVDDVLLACVGTGLGFVIARRLLVDRRPARDVVAVE